MHDASIYQIYFVNFAMFRGVDRFSDLVDFCEMEQQRHLCSCFIGLRINCNVAKQSMHTNELSI